MTRNQIEYWNLQETGRHNAVTERETERHNRVGETETNRHNVMTENIDIGKLNESIRHNKQTESLGWANLSETNRHNVATEDLGWANLGETSRHNQTQEGIDMSRWNEVKRHNQAQETLQGVDLNIQSDRYWEDKRHNVATENISQYDSETKRLAAEAQANYNNVKATWEGILNSQHIELTDKNIQQINKQMEKLDVDIENAKKYGNTIYWNQINDSINTLSNSVDAFIPG